jgi:antitoxin component YwqK of YwqJK toxin-antitoxin module
MFNTNKTTLILLLSTLISLSINCNETKYRYHRNGKVEVKEVSNKNGLVLWQHFSYYTGKLTTNDHYLNNKKHGRCARYYQDGTLKYECVFKNGKPYNGIWSVSDRMNCEPLNIFHKYYKYTNGEMIEIDFKEKDFPFRLTRTYQFARDQKNFFQIALRINISTNDGSRHGYGEINLKNAKIIRYDNECIKLIDSLSFIPCSDKKNSWIILEGITADGSYYLDSADILIDTNGVALKSDYIVKPNSGSTYDYRNLITINQEHPLIKKMACFFQHLFN